MLFTTLDAAQALGLSVCRVRQLEGEGQIKAIRTPKGFRLFESEDVQELLQRRKESKLKSKSKSKSK